MFNPITKSAGFTHEWFDKTYPEGYSKDQWCYPPPDNIVNFLHCNEPRTHFNCGTEHDSLVQEAHDLVKETHRDIWFSPISACLRFHFARNKITGNLWNLTQNGIEDEVHRIDPRVVSFYAHPPLLQSMELFAECQGALVRSARTIECYLMSLQFLSIVGKQLMNIPMHIIVIGSQQKLMPQLT